MRPLQLLILLMSLMLAGCFDNEQSNCPLKEPPNLTINFSLKDKWNNEVFGSRVDKVMLYIYNQDGKTVATYPLSQSELSEFVGLRCRLDPGTYSIVAWANTHTNYSEIVVDPNTHYTDANSNYLINAIAKDGVIDEGDPLYYTPKSKGKPLTVVIAEGKSTETTAEFRNAHIKLELTVEGYNNTSRATDRFLELELAKLTSRYDFSMNPHGALVSYKKLATLVMSDSQALTTMFNIPLFDITAPIEILVRDASGNLVFPVIILTDLLGGTINLDQTLHIPIIISFTEDGLSVDVTVDLPEWGEEIVKP